jgi:UbiD family decarboxylase
MNRLRDLRKYIEALAELGEIELIDRAVDSNLEIGAIIRRSYDLRAPAPLFNSVMGAEPGFRVFGAPAGLSARRDMPLCRVALSLGLDPATDGQTIVQTIAAALKRPGIAPRRVDSGPCQEFVMLGDQIDLNRLPVPLIHGGDGGRYLNTFGLNVVRSPDSSWVNWSINRMMVRDRNHLTGTFSFNQHIGMILSMWRDIDRPMPIAIALGVEPALPFLAGGMPLAARVNEGDFAGAYLDEPVDVVACKTVDLVVPASAEIVVEGLVSPTEKAAEGPMAEYPGYQFPGANTPKPLVTITAITHRHNPILPVVAAGPPVEEDHTAWGIPHAAQTLHDLREHDIPVSGVWLPFDSANHWMVVAIDSGWRKLDRLSRYTARQLCGRIGRIVFETKSGMDLPKIIVVENDIDITDTAQVVWAFATRCHPGYGHMTMGEEEMMILPVFLRQDEKRLNCTCKVVYNCLSQDDWKSETAPRPATFKDGWPADVQTRVLANWTAYGYSDSSTHRYSHRSDSDGKALK